MFLYFVYDLVMMDCGFVVDEVIICKSFIYVFWIFIVCIIFFGFFGI